MPKCDFNRVVEIALRSGCSSVNLLHVFRIPFDKNSCKGLLLSKQSLQKEGFIVRVFMSSDKKAKIVMRLLSVWRKVILF